MKTGVLATWAAAISLSLPCLLRAGEEAWVRYHDSPSGSLDIPRAIAVGPEGETYVTGGSGDFSEGRGDIVTVRFDADGTRTWTARYAGPGDPRWDLDGPCGIVIGEGGNIHVGGTSVGDGTGSDLVVVTYDLEGNEVWVARWDGTGGVDEAAGMAVEASGNIFIAGTSAGDGGDERNDIVTLKIAPDGTILWLARYASTPEAEDRAKGIAVDAAGNAYVTGFVGYEAAVMVKYDPDGNELWAATVEHGVERIGGIAVDEAGNAFVTGIYYFDDPYLFAMKYDPEGMEVWSEWTEIYVDYAGGVAVDGAGGLMATGMRTLDLAMTVVRFGPGGDVLWTAEADGPPLDSSIERPSSIILAADPSGGAYVAWPTDSEARIAKLGPDGVEVWMTAYPGPGSGPDEPRAMVLDRGGTLHLACASTRAGFDVDFAVLAYDASGNLLREGRWNGEGHGTDTSGRVFADGEGNVIVAGESFTNGNLTGITILKYDPQGKLLWTALHDGPLDDSLGDAAIDREGNLYATCSYGLRSLESPDHASEMVTIKWDAGGRKAWTTRYPVERGDQGQAIAVDAAGGVWIAGVAVLEGREGMAVLKYSPGGILLVEDFEESGGCTEQPPAIAIDAAGNASIAGNSCADGSMDVRVLKYSPDGIRLWARSYDSGGNPDYHRRIAVVPSGNILVLGDTMLPGLVWTDTLLEYGPDGRLLRDLHLKEPRDESWNFNHLAVDARGDIFLAGTCESGDALSFLTVKLGAGGEVLWRARFTAPGIRNNNLMSMAVGPAGNVCVTGDSTPDAEGPRISTVLYTPGGQEVWSKFFRVSDGLSSASGTAIDGEGNTFVAGTALYENGDYDMMVLKYESLPPVPFIRGDCDGDGQVTGSLTDPIFLLDYLFLGGTAPPCLEACDANGDGEAIGQVTDALYLLIFGFLGGLAPPSPYPGCGLPVDEVLGCRESPGCREGG